MGWFVGIPWWLALILFTVGLPFLIVYVIVRTVYEILVEGVESARRESVDRARRGR